MYVCMYVGVYIYIYTDRQVHMRKHTHALVHEYVKAWLYTHLHICVFSDSLIGQFRSPWFSSSALLCRESVDCRSLGGLRGLGIYGVKGCSHSSNHTSKYVDPES